MSGQLTPGGFREGMLRPGVGRDSCLPSLQMASSSWVRLSYSQGPPWQLPKHQLSWSSHLLGARGLSPHVPDLKTEPRAWAVWEHPGLEGRKWGRWLCV